MGERTGDNYIERGTERRENRDREGERDMEEERERERY